MPTPFIYWTLGGSLWVLVCLHIYWASLILKMAFKAAVEKGVGDDVRNVESKKGRKHE